jgi:hypothetical protein
LQYHASHGAQVILVVDHNNPDHRLLGGLFARRSKGGNEKPDCIAGIHSTCQ